MGKTTCRSMQRCKSCSFTSFENKIEQIEAGSLQWKIFSNSLVGYSSNFNLLFSVFWLISFSFYLRATWRLSRDVKSSLKKEVFLFSKIRRLSYAIRWLVFGEVGETIKKKKNETTQISVQRARDNDKFALGINPLWETWRVYYLSWATSPHS